MAGTSLSTETVIQLREQALQLGATARNLHDQAHGCQQMAGNVLAAIGVPMEPDPVEPDPGGGQPLSVRERREQARKAQLAAVEWQALAARMDAGETVSVPPEAVGRMMEQADNMRKVALQLARPVLDPEKPSS